MSNTSIFVFKDLKVRITDDMADHCCKRKSCALKERTVRETVRFGDTFVK